MLKKSEMKENNYDEHNIIYSLYLLNTPAASEYAKRRKTFLVLSRLCCFNIGSDYCFNSYHKIFSKARGKI